MFQNHCPTCKTPGYVKGIRCSACAGFEELTIPEPVTVNKPTPEKPAHGAFNSKELAARCGVSEKSIVKFRRRLPGAFRIGRMWRFDKVAIEKKLITGNLF